MAAGTCKLSSTLNTLNPNGTTTAAAATEQPTTAINLGSTERYTTKTLAKLLLGRWNDLEAKVFNQAIKECGKNFSAIKKDYLPWKSVRSIIEFYYLSLDKQRQQLIRNGLHFC